MNCSEIDEWQKIFHFEETSYSMTNRGLSITMPMMPVLELDDALLKLHLHNIPIEAQDNPDKSD